MLRRSETIKSFDDAWRIVKALAGLPEFEYEHYRRDAALALDWRVSQLDRAVSRLRKEKNAHRVIDAVDE